MAAAHDLVRVASGSLAYVDEEALLGFKIWVAELELLVRKGACRTHALCLWPAGCCHHPAFWPF